MNLHFCSAGYFDTLKTSAEKCKAQHRVRCTKGEIATFFKR